MPWMMQPTSTKRACNLLCYKVITSTIHLNCIRWIHWIRPGSAGLCWVRWVRHFFLIVGAGYLPTCLLASLDRTATMASGGFLSSFFFSLSFVFSLLSFDCSSTRRMRNWRMIEGFFFFFGILFRLRFMRMTGRWWRWWRTRLIGVISLIDFHWNISTWCFIQSAINERPLNSCCVYSIIQYNAIQLRVIELQLSKGIRM